MFYSRNFNNTGDMLKGVQNKQINDNLLILIQSHRPVSTQLYELSSSERVG